MPNIQLPHADHVTAALERVQQRWDDLHEQHRLAAVKACEDHHRDGEPTEGKQ